MTIYVRFSDCGQYICKWSREPFDCGAEFSELSTAPDVAVSREDALKFLGDACRNWDNIGPLSDDDVADVADALSRFLKARFQSTKAKGGAK